MPLLNFAEAFSPIRRLGIPPTGERGARDAVPLYTPRPRPPRYLGRALWRRAIRPLPSCTSNHRQQSFEPQRHQKALFVYLWACLARPSLLLAGWIVRKRLRAYMVPEEAYSPIRSFFEIFCSLANYHHLFVPDPMFYLRKGLCLLGICSVATPTLLGTISAEEHLELWIFALKHLIAAEGLTRPPQKVWKSPGLPLPGAKLGDHMRAVCATEVLRRVDTSTRLLLHRQALESLLALTAGN